MGQQRRLKQIRRMNRRAEAIYFAQIYGNDSAVAEPRIEEIYDELPIPVFSGNNFEFWVIKMKTLFRAKGVLSVVESGFKEPPNQTAYEVLPQSQKFELIENMRNDDVALFLIRQGLNERILPTIANAASAREAWECLRREFDVRGRNINQHQAERHGVEIQNVDAVVIDNAESCNEFKELVAEAKDKIKDVKEEKSNFENILMKDESNPVDAATQNKDENKMDENVIAEHEFEFYESHKNVNVLDHLQNDVIGAEAHTIEEKFAKEKSEKIKKEVFLCVAEQFERIEECMHQNATEAECRFEESDKAHVVVGGMKDESNCVDTVTQYEIEFEVEEKTLAGHEVELYEAHEDIKSFEILQNDMLDVSSNAIDENFAEIVAIEAEIEIEEGPKYDEEILSEAQNISIQKEMKSILNIMNGDEILVPAECKEVGNALDAIRLVVEAEDNQAVNESHGVEALVDEYEDEATIAASKNGESATQEVAGQPLEAECEELLKSMPMREKDFHNISIVCECAGTNGNQLAAEKGNEDDENCTFIAESNKTFPVCIEIADMIVQDECKDFITDFDADLKLIEEWLEKPNYVELNCTVVAAVRSLVEGSIEVAKMNEKDEENLFNGRIEEPMCYDEENEAEPVEDIPVKWNPEQIRHYYQLIAWQQLVQYKMDMSQFKSSEYNHQKAIKNFDDADGRIRPKDVNDSRFEESKKNVMLKKKMKLKEPKHSWFKVWRRRRWKNCKQI